jgi:carbonic anhydrase/acetyltransferase-like protein (isoleucine patch superfamily)
MGLILSVNGLAPKFGTNCFIAPNATITGDVQMGDGCSVWFNAVIRGDVHQIRIGNETNIQDGAIIHCTYKRAAVAIGDRVSIGHQAMIHGCTIGNDVLIGMGAILLDNCEVGDGCIVGAGSVVLEKTILEPGFLYAGTPAKKIKPVTESQREIIGLTAIRYPQYASWYDKSEF